MKIAHCTAWYYPTHTGGTEAYVKALAERLPSLGYPSAVLVPGSTAEVSKQGAIEVIRYPGRRACQQSGQNAGEAFRVALRRSGATAMHLHSWADDAGATQLREASNLGLPALTTLHLPAALCLRGTMVFQGQQACDKAIRHQDCAPCYLQARGWSVAVQRIWPRVSACMPRPVAERMAALRPVLDTVGLVGRMTTDLEEATQLSRLLVAVSRWQYDALIRNGVPPEKILLCRQGLTQAAAAAAAVPAAVLRVGYVGRLAPVKGVHVLVDAFLGLPRELPIELTIHGAAQGSEIESYEVPLRRKAEADRRIRFAGLLDPDRVFSALTEIDVLAVPSQWQETGPLVLLEAAAAGVPVLGSDLGGIPEWFEEGLRGWAVRFNSVEAWRGRLHDLATGPKPARSAQTVRTMDEVATEMAAAYARLLRSPALETSPSEAG